MSGHGCIGNPCWICFPQFMPDHFKKSIFENSRDAELAALRAELERLRVESHEETEHVEKLLGIITRTANALKGEPAPLTQHSWHDLPEVAAKLCAKVGAERAPFLLGFPDDSIEFAGYEFANGKTHEYVAEWWTEMLTRISNAEIERLRAKVAAGDALADAAGALSGAASAFLNRRDGSWFPTDRDPKLVLIDAGLDATLAALAAYREVKP